MSEPCEQTIPHEYNQYQRQGLAHFMSGKAPWNAIHSQIATYEIHQHHIGDALARILHDTKEQEGWCNDKKEAPHPQQTFEISLSYPFYPLVDIGREQRKQNIACDEPLVVCQYREKGMSHHLCPTMITQQPPGNEKQRNGVGPCHEPEVEHLLKSAPYAVISGYEDEHRASGIEYGIEKHYDFPIRHVARIPPFPHQMQGYDHHYCHDAQQFYT